MNKIKIGIVGYGNLGRGVEAGVKDNPDMILKAIFTKRNPKDVTINSNAKIFHFDDMIKFQNDIDVMILCGGSMSELPNTAPFVAEKFNTVDGFDTHAKIPEYFENMDKNAKAGENVSIIASGWDPGLFSLNRLLGTVVLPKGGGDTFWGKGVSQGHSDAIRRIDGVLDARQYTVPIENAMDMVRCGKGDNLSIRDKHLRWCYVVAKEGANLSLIEEKIKTMPNYFADYDTTVNFIDEKEMREKHNKLFHGGFVIRSGNTGFKYENHNTMEFKLSLDSNPEFTANVLLAYARAAFRLNSEGRSGAMTIFDIAPKYLSILSAEELRKTLL